MQQSRYIMCENVNWRNPGAATIAIVTLQALGSGYARLIMYTGWIAARHLCEHFGINLYKSWFDLN